MMTNSDMIKQITERIIIDGYVSKFKDLLMRSAHEDLTEIVAYQCAGIPWDERFPLFYLSPVVRQTGKEIQISRPDDTRKTVPRNMILDKNPLQLKRGQIVKVIEVGEDVYIVPYPRRVIFEDGYKS